MCLFLLKPYSACDKHAAVLCYSIILKSPHGRSKPESTLRAEASKTEVAIHNSSVSEEDSQVTKMMSVIVTEEKLLHICNNRNTIASLACYSTPENSA